MSEVRGVADVVTFGEGMVRLTAPGYQRLESVTQLEVAIGGAELNVAVALARLGVTSSWVSALPENALGRLLASETRRHGVDLSHVVWRTDARMGVYFMERGAYPRPSQVTYDRADSAVNHLGPGDLDWEVILRGARVLHTSGITPALSAPCRARALEAFAAARRLGVTTSFDTNYRSKLWSGAEARRCLDEVLPLADYVFSSPADLQAVFGLSGEPEALASDLKSRFGCSLVALSLRGPCDTPGRLSRRSLLVAERAFWGEPVEHEVVDPLGSGDAFTAGVLCGALRGDLALAVRLGDALAALKQTIPGDFSRFSRAEVDAVLANPSSRVER